MEEKKDRLQRLNKVVNEQFAYGNHRFLGEVVEVLVDGVSKTNNAVYAGYTPNNKLVNFNGREDQIGKIVPVKIIKAKTWSLDGEVLDELS